MSNKKKKTSCAVHRLLRRNNIENQYGFAWLCFERLALCAMQGDYTDRWGGELAFNSKDDIHINMQSKKTQRRFHYVLLLFPAIFGSETILSVENVARHFWLISDRERKRRYWESSWRSPHRALQNGEARFNHVYPTWGIHSSSSTVTCAYL